MEKHETTAVCEHLRLVVKQVQQLQLKQEPSTPPAATVSLPFLYNQVPTEIIISDFSEKKEAKEEWKSSPFYTHNRGYKFRLQVYPNGNITGSGSHLSVYAQLMRGEYDNELEWPFEGYIIVELLNWRADKNDSCFSHTIDFNRYNDPDGTYSTPVTDQETATGYGCAQLSRSLTDLVPNTNTEYLRDDYLKLRVSAKCRTPAQLYSSTRTASVPP